MALNQWRAVLTDMVYTPVGELQNVSDRSLSMALNRNDTASFTIRADNPFADLVQSLDCFLKLYRNNELLFFGLLQSSEESVGAEGAKITASAAGPGWVFPKRYPIRQANAGFGVTSSRSAVASFLLNELQHQSPQFGPGDNPVLFRRAEGDMGISLNSLYSAGGTIQYFCPPYKPMSEVLNELSNASDGFDWRITAFENWIDGELIEENSGYKHGKFIVGAPLGTMRDEAIFEFGDGRRNLQGYTRTRSRETQANEIMHLLNGQPEDNPSFASYPGHEYRELYMPAGMINDIVQADITDRALRDQLVAEHLAVRNKPRDIVEWTPIADYGDGRLPRFGLDYNIGDFVTGRAKYNGSIRFSGTFRVWGVDFSIDSAGVETPKVTLEYQG